MFRTIKVGIVCLCRKILGKEEEEKMPFSFDDYVAFNNDKNINDDNKDDDSSWESLNSGDDYEEELGLISSSVAAPVVAAYCKSDTERVYMF
mmetsp:Transcript_34750/g.50935  ORF Transcript_34750/g.50935 Transcript_34750/m.50935 type:complete len:92 (-) Transcript_34750:212-487(-)